MNTIEEKLDKFTRTVMMEATQKRARILQEIKLKRASILEQRELEYLEQAYHHIQKEMHKAERDKNEKISQAFIEGKARLFTQREKVIETLFSKIMNRLKIFKQSEEYLPFLYQAIKKGVEVVGQGNIVVLLEGDDMHLSQKIQAVLGEELGLDIKVKPSDIDIIGGCKVYNEELKVMADCSLGTRLEEEREQFIKKSGLIIQ